MSLTQPVLKRSTSAPSASTPMERSVAPVAQRTVSTHTLKDALDISATDYESETPPTILPRLKWSLAQKRRFKLVNDLLEKDVSVGVTLGIFGSTVRMMMGMCPFRETSDVDCMVGPMETVKFLSLLRRYGETVVTTTPGSASYTGTRCKVTTVTSLFGKGTVFEDEFDGDFTEISFDIVEVSREYNTYAETVKKMNYHVQSWIATGATTFQMVPSERTTVDITLLEQVIRLMKGWKYMIRPEYKGQFLLDAPVKLRWYYFKHLQLAIRHDDRCIMCQEEFLPDDKVMHLSCGCRNGHVGHVKCFMPWLIKRLNGILAARRGNGSPDRPDGKCGQCDRHFIMNQAPSTLGLTPSVRCDGGEIVRDYKIPSEVFNDIFGDIFY